jgi:peptidoglycan/LPS O-acetylase OafA/YrhL
VNGTRHTYVPAFDGLRGVAILPVVFLHVGVSSLPNGSLLYQLSRGWYGVDLFFVLSGFLITWILDAEIDASGTIDLKRFYARRVLRLAPAYVSTLLVVLLGAALLDRSQLERVPKVLPSLLTYTYNLQVALGGPHVDVLIIVWSLCVEEQFYLMWPWVLRRLGRRRGLWFCILTVVILSAYRSALYAWLNWGHLATPSTESANRIYFATDTRVGVILVGCALALSMRHPRAHRLWKRMSESTIVPIAVALVALGCIVFVTGGSPSSASWRSATFGYTLGACATAALIAAVFMQPHSIVARALSWRPLVAIGRISYGAYLFHLAVAWLVIGVLRPALWAQVAWRFSNPALGAALPVSEATVVPLSGAMGYVSALAAANPIFRFTIALVLVLTLTLAAAALHYRYVESWFMARRRPAPGRAHLPGRAS